MDIRMNWNDATFKLSDVIKIVTFCVLGAIAWVSLKEAVSNIGNDIAEIRQTQIENTKRNEARWNIIEAKQNQIDMQYRLLEQRVKQIEDKK